MGKVDLTSIAGAVAAPRDTEKLREAVTDLYHATLESTAAVRLGAEATRRVEAALGQLAAHLEDMTARMDALGARVNAMAETVERHAALVQKQIESGR